MLWGSGERPPEPPLGGRNRSTALQSISHNGRHDKETSKGSRKCQGDKMMGPRTGPSGDLHMAHLHGWFLSPPPAAPPPLPSAPRMVNVLKTAQGAEDRALCVWVCLCVSVCVGGFRKGRALGHQREFDANFDANLGVSRSALSVRRCHSATWRAGSRDPPRGKQRRPFPLGSRCWRAGKPRCHLNKHRHGEGARGQPRSPALSAASHRSFAVSTRTTRSRHTPLPRPAIAAVQVAEKLVGG